MKQITYQEAIDLVAHGGREDIQVATVVRRMGDVPLLELHNLASLGALFYVEDLAGIEPASGEPAVTTESIKHIPKDTTHRSKKTGSAGVKKKIDTGKVLVLRAAGWNIKDIAGEMGVTEVAVSNVISLAEKYKEDKDE